MLTDKEKIQGFSISDKSACIIGCGGLGCNISVHLTGSGIGKLFLCDFDTVTYGNLNRQFLYTEKDISKSKCNVAKMKLEAYNPETDIEAIERKIEKVSDLDFASECDIVLLAVDNAEARIIAQKFCKERSIPLVCAGIDGFYGLAYLYVPDKSPCPECAGMNFTGKAEYNISSTAGTVGALQASLAEQYLLTENADLAGKLLIYDNGIYSTLSVRPSSGCSECN